MIPVSSKQKLWKSTAVPRSLFPSFIKQTSSSMYSNLGSTHYSTKT